ncbi:hypothetical protein [Bradyrhizobium sp.]|jgi:hypothetical protein|uniref:hypothetical protein n=1 Tax=Bradyrhizobium sp. TaxID=376 RepID=UPI003C203EF4
MMPMAAVGLMSETVAPPFVVVRGPGKSSKKSRAKAAEKTVKTKSVKKPPKKAKKSGRKTNSSAARKVSGRPENEGEEVGQLAASGSLIVSAIKKKPASTSSLRGAPQCRRAPLLLADEALRPSAVQTSKGNEGGFGLTGLVTGKHHRLAAREAGGIFASMNSDLNSWL